MSTHSDALLTEQGIDSTEVLLLTPAKEGTEVKRASEISEVESLLKNGLTVAEAVLSRTKPEHLERLSLL